MFIAGAICVKKVSLSPPRSRQKIAIERKVESSSGYNIRLVYYANFISIGFACRKYRNLFIGIVVIMLKLNWRDAIYIEWSRLDYLLVLIY